MDAHDHLRDLWDMVAPPGRPIRGGLRPDPQEVAAWAIDALSKKITCHYAVTVTVKQGDQEVTKRYEAPTAEEAKRMAGECDMEQTPTGGK